MVMIFAERIHRLFEGIAKRYLEARIPPAPDAPAVINDIIVQFANAYPEATRDDWRSFTRALATEMYGRGYDDGRLFNEPIDFAAPDGVMNQIDRQWRETEPVDLLHPNVIVLDEQPSDGIITDEQIRRMNSS
jgi:hypothetical protein